MSGIGPIDFSRFNPQNPPDENVKLTKEQGEVMRSMLHGQISPTEAKDQLENLGMSRNDAKTLVDSFPPPPGLLFDPSQISSPQNPPREFFTKDQGDVVVSVLKGQISYREAEDRLVDLGMSRGDAIQLVGDLPRLWGN